MCGAKSRGNQVQVFSSHLFWSSFTRGMFLNGFIHIHYAFCSHLFWSSFTWGTFLNGFIHIHYTFCFLLNYLRSLFTIFLFLVVMFLWVTSLFGNKFTVAFSITWTINLTLSTLLLEFVSLYSHGLFLFISEWMKNLESKALIPTQSILEEEQSHSMKLERYIWDDPWFSRLEVLGCKDQLEMYHVNQSTAMTRPCIVREKTQVPNTARQVASLPGDTSRHGFDPWSGMIPHAAGQLSLNATTAESEF